MDYEKLYKKAKLFGERVGLGSEAEDFAQEFLIQAFKHGPIKLKYVFFNYRDRHRTHKRMLSAPQGQFSGARIISLDAPINNQESDSAQFSDVIGSLDAQLERVGEVSLLDSLISGANGRIKDVAKGLAFGGTQEEIADSLGVSQSRVCQLTKRIKEMILILRIVPDESIDWVIKHAL